MPPSARSLFRQKRRKVFARFAEGDSLFADAGHGGAFPFCSRG
jgi:hypothetical protein